MVRDCDIGVAKCLRCCSHFLDRIFSVARGCVHLQIALHVFTLEQVRQFVPFGGFDFAAVFAKFWRNVVELQLGVDFLFRAPRDVFFAFERCELILVQRVAHFVRAAAKPHVVLSGAREIQKGRTEIFLFQQAHIDLQSILERETDFVLAVGKRLVDIWKFQDVFGERVHVFLRGVAVRECHQQIQITDGFLPAAQ